MSDELPSLPQEKLRELQAKVNLTPDEKELLTYLQGLKAQYDDNDAKSAKMNEIFPNGGRRPFGAYYDLKGKQIGMWEWSELQHTHKIIARSEMCGYLVSTVYLGIDHGFNDEEPPLIFETMVFGQDERTEKTDLHNYQYRYFTLEEAKEGHQEICKMVMSSA